MQVSVSRFCPLHKTINIGNGTECLLRCCSAARILHSERPAFACDCRSYGWVAQLAEQWTENPRVGGSVSPPTTLCVFHILRGTLVNAIRFDRGGRGLASPPGRARPTQW